MELQVESQVSWSFLNIIPNKQTNLQAQIIQKMEDSQHLSCIPARTKYYKEGANE